jgi:hypothetical protein
MTTFRQEARKSIADACSLWGADPEIVVSRKRSTPHVHARHAAMWAMRRMGWSYVGLGRYFSRDHSSVIHAFNCVEEWIATGHGDGSRAETVLRQLRRYRWTAPENAATAPPSARDIESISTEVCARSFATNDPAEPVEQLTFAFAEAA